MKTRARLGLPRGDTGAYYTVVARRPLTVRSQPTLQPSSSGRSRQILPGTTIKSRRVVQRVLSGRKHTFVEVEDAAGGWVFTPSKSGVQLLERVDAPLLAKDAPNAMVSSAAAHPVAAPRMRRPAGLTTAALQAAYAAGHLVYKCTAPRDISIRCKDTFDLVMDTGLKVTADEYVLVARITEPKQAPAYTPDVGHGRGRGHGGRGRGRGGRRRHGKKHHGAVAPPEPIMVTFIQLADMRGWLLDKDPSSGVEWMQCIEENPALKRAREDAVLKQAVIEEGKTLWKSESEQQLQKLEASLRNEQIALEETLEERVTEEAGLLMRAADQLKSLQAKLKEQEAVAATEMERVRGAALRDATQHGTQNLCFVVFRRGRHHAQLAHTHPPLCTAPLLAPSLPLLTDAPHPHRRPHDHPPRRKLRGKTDARWSSSKSSPSRSLRSRALGLRRK